MFGVGPAEHAAHLAGWPEPASVVRSWDAHLTPLNLAALVGLPGLCLFGWFLYRVLSPSLRAVRAGAIGAISAADGVHVALCVALGATVFDMLSLDAEDFRHLWLLAGLVVATAPPTTRSAAQ